MSSRADATDDRLVYDVGLHDGVDTGFYLDRGYRVVAVDANPEAVAAARTTFGDAIASGLLTLIHGAVTQPGGPESVRLYVSARPEWSSLVPELAGRDGVETHEVVVPATSISRLLEEFGTPIYLKIDIEGMDDVALRDLATTPSRPTYVSVEAESVDESGGSEENALTKLDLLSRMGYGRFKLVDQDSLRVLSMRELALGPRTTLHARVRRRLGKPPRGRTNVVRVDGRRTQFPLGASGPFGSDLPGEWLDANAARELLSAARRAYFLRDDARPHGFWCDWHATG